MRDECCVMCALSRTPTRWIKTGATPNWHRYDIGAANTVVIKRRKKKRRRRKSKKEQASGCDWWRRVASGYVIVFGEALLNTAIACALGNSAGYSAKWRLDSKGGDRIDRKKNNASCRDVSMPFWRRGRQRRRSRCCGFDRLSVTFCRALLLAVSLASRSAAVRPVDRERAGMAGVRNAAGNALCVSGIHMCKRHP